MYNIQKKEENKVENYQFNKARGLIPKNAKVILVFALLDCKGRIME